MLIHSRNNWRKIREEKGEGQPLLRMRPEILMGD
jgi:hypothetical protein